MGASVHSQLSAGERIVSSFSPYHATSRRLLLYAETGTGMLLRELQYSRIESIDLVNAPDHRLIALGVVVALIGFALTLAFGLILVLLSLPLGIFAIGAGVAGRPAYYQIKGKEMSPKDLPVWQVTYSGAGSFIASIRTILGEGRRL